MTITDWTGSIGVAILLAAYFLNLRDLIRKDSLVYLLLNMTGAGLAICGCNRSNDYEQNS